MEIALVLIIIICIVFYETKLIGERSARQAELKDLWKKINKLEDEIFELKTKRKLKRKPKEDIKTSPRPTPEPFNPFGQTCLYACPTTDYNPDLGFGTTTSTSFNEE